GPYPPSAAERRAGSGKGHASFGRLSPPSRDSAPALAADREGAGAGGAGARCEAGADSDRIYFGFCRERIQRREDGGDLPGKMVYQSIGSDAVRLLQLSADSTGQAGRRLGKVRGSRGRFRGEGGMERHRRDAGKPDGGELVAGR